LLAVYPLPGNLNFSLEYRYYFAYRNSNAYRCLYA
jgi:hypothetical protein